MIIRSSWFKKTKLGILGGGQLGRMLIEASSLLPVDISILTTSLSSPAALISKQSVCGDFRDYQTVVDFGKGLDVITMEIEDVNVDALVFLQTQGVAVYPDPQVIAMIQDKGLQKQFFKEHHIPTSEFIIVDDPHNDTSYSAVLPAFQKIRRMGYDGRGVQKICNLTESSLLLDGPSVFERLVDFEREISVIVARDIQGNISSFPVVDMEVHPHKNLLNFLTCPSTLSSSLQEQAQNLACDVAQKIKNVGVMAVEMFVTRDGKVLVNELAPRPHNSGHHSIEANACSQYEQHLRAILGLELGDPRLNQPCVCFNVLGKDGHEGRPVYIGVKESCDQKGVYVHIYGKHETRPYRKMGHVTVVGATLDEAKKVAYKIQNQIQVIT